MLSRQGGGSMVRCLQLKFFSFLWLLCMLGVAQTPSAPRLPQLSPGAAYEEAMRPLEVTRHSIANWSDMETAALAVSIGQAEAGCAARDPKDFSGPDLIDMARLCSLGLSYPQVVQATTRYIAAAGPKPQLTQAYASLIDALLRMKDEHDALAYAQTMLDSVPYDALTAETIQSALGFMQFVYTPDALSLATKREPLLLERLHAAAAVANAVPPAMAQSHPVAESQQSIHELYADGIALAMLQQLSRVPEAVIAVIVAELDTALPVAMKPDDAIPIALTRRRYAMLGQPLPEISHPAHPANSRRPAVLHTLDLPGRLPKLPAVNAITGLLLFPDWCAQCIRMATKLPQTVFTVEGHEAYLYGLLAPTVAQTAPVPETSKPKAAGATATFAPADASNLLRGSATLVGDPSLLEQFAATDVPMLILTDSQGMVRVMQPVSDDAGQPGGTIDAAIALIGDTWPNPKLAPHQP